MSRYQRVFTYIWQDESFSQLDGHCQRLFLYLLSSPHSNLIGLYSLPPSYACGDLNCKEGDFLKWVDTVVKSGMAEYDKDAKVVWIKNYLSYNPLSSPNHVKAGHKSIKALPKTALLGQFVAHCDELPEENTRGVHLDIPEDLTGWTPPVVEKEEKKEKPKEEKKVVITEGVTMTPKKFQALSDEFGSSIAREMCERLADYKLSKPKKYKCDYRAIRTWVIDDFRKRGLLKEKPRPSAGSVDAMNINPEEMP